MITKTEKGGMDMDDFEKKRVEKAQKKLDDLKSKRKKDYWSPKPGKNSLRILPNWDGDPEGDFYRETGYHRKLGTARDKSVVCLLREGFDRCPVCEMVRELYKTKNAEDKELAKDVKVQTRILYNIIDLDDASKGVQVWMSGVDVLEQILAYCANPKYGWIPDPENGRNIDVVFTEGKNTKSGYNEYNIQPDPDRSVIADSEWLIQMVDLNSLVKLTPIEEVEVLLGGSPSEVGGKAPVEEKSFVVLNKLIAKFPCFGKFSSEDAECQKCPNGSPCKEARGMLMKPGAEPKSEPKPEPKSEPKPEPKSEPKAKEAPKADAEVSPVKKGNIKEMLSKLREEKAKK